MIKEEENPANGVLGNVESNPNGTVPEDDDVGDEDEGNDEGAEPADGDEEENMDEDEPEGDLQVAWEALDVRRKIICFFLQQKLLSVSSILLPH